MTNHAEIAPSKMARIVQCPGSLALGKLFPQSEDNPYAAEGRIAHAVAANILNGIIHPVGGNVTPEMLDGAGLWKDTLSSFTMLNVEQTVNLNEHVWGTPDVWAWEGDILMVADYKFGHKFVTVEKNWQLITYASAILEQRKPDKPKNFMFIIVQPRSFHRSGPIRSWEISYNEFCGYRQQMLDAVERAIADEYTKVGPECVYCNGRHACEAYAGITDSIFDLVSNSSPLYLPDNAVGKELELMEEAALLIKGRITGLQEDIKSRIQKGVNVRGWSLAPGYGREEWAKPIPEVLLLGQLMGLDLSKPDAVTPKQAIKLGIPAEIVRGYSITKDNGVKLVKEQYNGQFD